MAERTCATAGAAIPADATAGVGACDGAAAGVSATRWGCRVDMGAHSAGWKCDMHAKRRGVSEPIVVDR